MPYFLNDASPVQQMMEQLMGVLSTPAAPSTLASGQGQGRLRMGRRGVFTFQQNPPLALVYHKTVVFKSTVYLTLYNFVLLLAGM